MAAMIAYTRRSTDRQDTSHEAQLDAIRAARGDDLIHVRDTCSGSMPLHERDGGAHALELLSSGEAEGLVVAKLDRLCRSVLDGAELIQRAQREGWTLVSLDLGLDTGTPMGAAMAHVALAFAELERERLRERTREGLAVARKRGVRLGAPPLVPEDVAERIVRERARGVSYGRIAEQLNRDNVPTTRGGQRWYASTVRVVAERAGRQEP